MSAHSLPKTKQPNINNAPAAAVRRQERHADALDFAGTLVMLRTPKKTALISIMQQHGLNVRDARAIYAEAAPRKKVHHGSR